MSGDRNFDDLAHRFASNVYQTLKGQIRLAVIERDLKKWLPELYQAGQLTILDAGCGRAPVSVPLLGAGHHLTLVDLSVEMLKLALADAERFSPLKPVWFHDSIVHFQQQSWSGQPFDLVLCHAVLEWVAEPTELLASLQQMVKPGGWLSIIFYNVDGLIYKNLLRTNFRKIREGKLQGGKRSLTPTYPRCIDEVLGWLAELNLSVVAHSGIRVFHDYIFNEADRTRAPEELLAMELQFSQRSPYRELGRYQHLLLRRI
ncbi:methyltransferase [Halioxenophilus sp. WMMB6]|uniref:methyltransferase n=1 Tax=Halioxenophilus sp. WMMB6 TaxID=3073815 RepID=UPI00295E3843|nr:methyltransferase [Halioxenophilus sp. WMMB6]